LTRRSLFRLALGLAAVAAVAGCGKKGPPQPPDPATDEFPRQYPKPQ